MDWQHWFVHIDSRWLLLGFAGQALFSMRFILQWLHSEARGKSVVPIAFWYFSIFGGVTLFAYAVHRRDPVIMLGQGLGIFIYVRNLYLIYRERSHASQNTA